MRILHVLDHSLPLQSGYTFRTLGILRAQRDLGWETHHLTSPKQGNAEMSEETVNGWRFYRTPESKDHSDIPVLREMQLMRALGRRLIAVANEIKPDLIQVHSPVLNALPAIWAGRRLSLPVVYEVRAFWEDAAVDHGSTTEGSMRYRVSQWAETYALRRAGHITTICEGLKSDMIRRGILSQKITVIPNAVDPAMFAFRPERDEKLSQALGLEGYTILGFIGSFYGYEGLDLLLRALPEILAHDPGVKVLLVGGGPQEENWRSLARELGLGDRVVFTGRVPHDRIQDYYSLVDVLVYPRYAMRLTELVTPLKPLEAMAQGILLIASDVGGHRELIRDGTTGMLFRANDTKSLAGAVRRLLSQRTSWHEMRTNGRRFVESERTWRASAERYKPVFERLCPRTQA
jgi:PEP-CTERM/exosortase A-associated glycosyltransferase